MNQSMFAIYYYVPVLHLYSYSVESHFSVSVRVGLVIFYFIIIL